MKGYMYSALSLFASLRSAPFLAVRLYSYYFDDSKLQVMKAGNSGDVNIRDANVYWPERGHEQGIKTCSFLLCSFLDLLFLLEFKRMGRKCEFMTKRQWHL